jgi:hypothetical protein
MAVQLFLASRWVDGDPMQPGVWDDEDRAFIAELKVLYPELSDWGDLALGCAFGRFSEDVFLISWAHWLTVRSPAFLAYLYIRQVNPHFCFGRTGGWESQLEALASAEPWLTPDSPLPDWACN